MSYKIIEQEFVDGDRVDLVTKHSEHNSEEAAKKAALERAEMLKSCFEDVIDGELIISDWEEDNKFIVEISEELGPDNYGIDDYKIHHRIVVTEREEYEITADWMGDNDRPVTEDDFEWIREYAQEDIEGWTFSVQVSGDELRVYAERDGADVEDGIPSLIRGWQKITDDSYYTRIGTLSVS